ncbi:MAG: Cys-Gln thioester bond-forming surface protein [Clostridia bacterium]|nr:Cys-Gln thioester bond-forming surface protein [Clostridia bacterium]
MKKISKKILSILMLIIILINTFSVVISNATEITSAALVKIGECDYHLKYYREDSASYRYVICTVVGHYNNNIFYPAYCLNKDLTGVTEDYSYAVNIKEVINRDDVWRVVKNGYPYKSYQEMGLSNAFNAYAVTKFAVYCILGQSDINKFYAEPNDAEAIAMLNCLKNLVNIGINGTETRQNGNFSIVKSGDIAVEGNYYTQQYKVFSNIEMNNLEIAATVGLPTGSYAQKINNSTIKLFIPKSQVKENIHGIIHLKGQCKTYPIFYGESGNPNYQDYAITYDVFGEVSSSCKVEQDFNKGKLKVLKIDSETKEKISNITFGLYKNGALIQTKKTDQNGIIIFEKLFPGEYIVKELETNKEYVISEKEEKINIEYNKQTDITIMNTRKKGNLKIVKVDKDDKIVLEGVEFELYTDKGKKLGKYVTDSNGEINVTNLNIGNYKLKEIKSKEGYKLLEEISLEIKWNETLELKLSNEKNKGRIKVIKVDKDNNEIKIPGVKFGVYNQENKLLETLITDNNGEAISKSYPIYKNEYYVKELETNQNYILNNESVKVELKENQITNIKFENEFKKGNLELLKYDKDTKEALQGVEFELYDSKNNFINKYITDENGRIFIDNLKINKNYYLKEVKTNPGYKMSQEKINFDINYNETTKLEIFNEKIKSNFKIIKVDKDNNNIKLSGVKFAIYNEKNELLEEIITNEKGEAESGFYPVYNKKYYIQELETKENYDLNLEKIVIELKENETILLQLENELKKGKLEILKLDSDTKETLEGVEFELYDLKNNLIGTYKTNKEGKIVVENLKPQKNYYIKEIKTKEEYKLLEKPVMFEIKPGEITSLEIINEKIKGKLKIIKVDKNDKDKKLEGVSFDIYDEKSNLLETITTDKNGCAYSSLLPSVNRIYTVSESKTLPGYIKNEEYIFFKFRNSDIYELIVENEKEKVEEVIEKEVPKVEVPKEEKIDIPEKKENIVKEEVISKQEEVKILPRTGY